MALLDIKKYFKSCQTNCESTISTISKFSNNHNNDNDNDNDNDDDDDDDDDYNNNNNNNRIYDKILDRDWFSARLFVT